MSSPRHEPFSLPYTYYSRSGPETSPQKVLGTTIRCYRTMARPELLVTGVYFGPVGSPAAITSARITAIRGRLDM